MTTSPMDKHEALWLLRLFIDHLEGCDEVGLVMSDDIPRLGLVNDPLDPAPAFVVDRGTEPRHFEITVKTRKETV